jgi:hypothetical protein
LWIEQRSLAVPLAEVRDLKQISGGYEVQYRDHRDGNTKPSVRHLFFWLAELWARLKFAAITRPRLKTEF